MNFLYGFGVIIGIGALYAGLTLGLAFLFSFAEKDIYKRFLLAWVFGFILFIIVSVIALNKAGAFDIVRSNEAIEEVEE